MPSVLRPRIRPSSNTSVFTAPACRASGSTASQSAKAASLCGMVTFSPAKPAAARPRTAVANRAGGAGNGT